MHSADSAVALTVTRVCFAYLLGKLLVAVQEKHQKKLNQPSVQYRQSLAAQFSGDFTALLNDYLLANIILWQLFGYAFHHRPPTGDTLRIDHYHTSRHTNIDKNLQLYIINTLKFTNNSRTTKQHCKHDVT